MTVPNNDVRNTLKSYLDLYPADTPNLRFRTNLLANSFDVTTRGESRGHVTASAVTVNPSGRVLLIHHLASDQWIQPGGHLEPGTVLRSRVRLPAGI